MANFQIEGKRRNYDYETLKEAKTAARRMAKLSGQPVVVYKYVISGRYGHISGYDTVCQIDPQGNERRRSHGEWLLPTEHHDSEGRIITRAAQKEHAA